MVAGYVIMRLALVAQWLRAAHSDPRGRAGTLRYAAGITVVQLGWIGSLWLTGVPGRVSFAVWAEFGGRATPWHPGHISERYGLFTIIVPAR